MNSNNPRKSFGAELRLMLRRARQVWRLVPTGPKWALGFAAGIMAVTSLCNTALPMLLGRLVDEVKAGTEQGLDHASLYRLAAWLLGLVGEGW